MKDRVLQGMLKSLGGKTLGRFALPVTVGLSLYSAARTVSAEIERRGFEEDHLRPLREEAARWTAALSALDAAAAELSYSESVPFPHTRYSPATGVTWKLLVKRPIPSPAAEGGEMMVVHDPDPGKARELIASAREELSSARDRRKVNLRRRLRRLEERLESVDAGELGDADFEGLKKRVAVLADALKKVRSDLEYELSRLDGGHAGRRDRWALTVAGLALFSALSAGVLPRRRS